MLTKSLSIAAAALTLAAVGVSAAEARDCAGYGNGGYSDSYDARTEAGEPEAVAEAVTDTTSTGEATTEAGEPDAAAEAETDTTTTGEAEAEPAAPEAEANAPEANPTSEAPAAEAEEAEAE